MTATLDVIDSYLALDSTQYAQVPIGATRVATKGNGTNLYGTIPVWTVTGPYEIEMDVVFPTTAVSAIKVFFDSDDANSRTFFYLSATGALRYSGATAMYVDGVLVADNGANHPLDGGVHHIKLVNTGTVKISNIGRKYDGTYYISSAMFNLRLTDVNNPSNSRFYPMDNSYGYTVSGSAIESTQTLTDHFNDTDFYYWQLISGTATIDEVSIPSSAGRFLVGSTIAAQSGASLRFNFEAGVIKIDHHFVIKLEVLSGDCTTFYADICDAIGGTATLSGNVITIQGIRTSDKAADATYKFVDFNISGGTNLTFKVLSITQTPAIRWYNRTSGDVVTVYPDAIKPAETFFMAARLRVTSLGSETYPMAFSVGGALGSTIVKLQLRQSGGLVVEVWDISSTGVKTNIGGITIPGIASDGNWVPIGTFTIVFKKNGTTGLSEGWASYGNQNLYISTSRPINGYAIQGKINLNGEIDTSENIIRKLSGINIHYVYLYSSLSAGDITALMQGANPETVGTIRQGYNLNGNGNEVNGGNALTLYNAPSFVRHTLFPKLVDSLIRRELIPSLIGSVIS